MLLGMYFLGLEVMANRFGVIVTVMKKKPYDFLDQRKTDFDIDYDEFKRQIQELHVCSMRQDIITISGRLYK